MREYGPIVLFTCLPALACASLQSFADDAERYRKEVADTMLAVQAVLDACEEIAEPKPSLCVEAKKLEKLLEPYVPGVR